MSVVATDLKEQQKHLMLYIEDEMALRSSAGDLLVLTVTKIKNFFSEYFSLSSALLPCRVWSRWPETSGTADRGGE